MTARTCLAALAGATLTVVTAISACGLEPDVGPPLAGACSDTDTDPAAGVSFATQIRPLLNRSLPMGGCGCHMPTAAGPTPAIQLSGLDLGSLFSLRSGGRTSGSQIVVAREPCSSVLYQKVSDAPPFGSRMPLGGPPFLTAEEQDLVHDWIAEGAADN